MLIKPYQFAFHSIKQYKIKIIIRSYYSLRTNLFIPTIKEIPNDAFAISHQLLVRAGYIRRTAQGIYSILPLGERTLKNIENIIDNEMNKKNVQRILLPTLTPSILWKTSKRWDIAGPELFRLKDRHENTYCLAPTHEETITDIISNCVFSYKQLPLRLYQISKKFRDEIRPRFGLLRGKEFIMKDAYTFDINKDKAIKTYYDMMDAYHNIFSKLNINYVKVQANAGIIGGDFSHEFHVVANIGEDILLSCGNDKCSYAANIEKATGLTKYSKIIKLYSNIKDNLSESLCNVLEDLINRENMQLNYVLIEKKDNLNVVLGMFLLPLDEKINFTNVLNVLSKEKTIELLNNDNIYKHIEIVFDDSLDINENRLNKWKEKVKNHFSNRSQNISIKQKYIRLSKENDICPKCKNNKLIQHKGIEVGHVFYLGTKYSDSFKAHFAEKENNNDKNKQQKLSSIQMGCYGIGITRLLAAIVENLHDKKGIIWPYEIAPYKIIIIGLGFNKKNENTMEENNFKDSIFQLANALENTYYPNLNDGYNIVVDDRWYERPGIKLNESELIGYPYIIIFGKLFVSNKIVEIKERRTDQSYNVHIDNVISFFNKKL